MRLVRPAGSPTAWSGSRADRQGLAGEDAVIAALSAALDDRYLAIARLRLPGTEADIDLVVLASAVIVLEVKTYAGPRRYACEGSLWRYADDAGSWWPLDAAPGTQATWGARRLRLRLGGVCLAARVQAAVVWAGEAPLRLDRPDVPVLRLAALPGWLAEIAPAPQARVARLARLLLAGG